MKFVTTLTELRQERAKLPGPVGFVPTMGYLHAGHISLAQTARQSCASVIASIFVNPTQFAPTEDLAQYPRDLDHDLQLLESAGVDLVWAPTADMMYPAGFQTWVTVEEVTRPLEGLLRPTHFRGVSTVVAKLFNAVQPDRAYFGQKDAQQAVVIRRMVADLNFPIEIVVCPIVREQDGLALSSRNTYLNPQERQAATVLSRALRTAQQAYLDGERSGDRLCQIMGAVFADERLAKLQYAVCVHPDTLQNLEKVEDRALLLVAALVGRTRLIDNMPLP